MEISITEWKGMQTTMLTLGDGLLRLHGREEKDLLDVGRVGQEHDQSVNSETESSRRGKTVFEAA
jgi:hypothetical protein